ncbi:FAA hydrolase family protein (plasmid) [Deinococcus metallilatus]|uniref:2-keto-4-pentenoate hydratase/2-oxohepta-3-ene-1,7-dioic acid hydratase in catechol pathway n=1 Tax=Deinococcus metallilatus TaxID=1211322 RepID=A0AAJ5K1K8_9DEIO|nr:fumarylacetoacetate hydrolase family protein [Deinococcus metallilatus]MBB5293505.1 2-keto-4-pentenoate hydratase/2-oxohepta-3-ene-1,7-dioic acid hydratase in catechol pathway [Deinococcus metallilatus]QBY06584.1 FAA hydrolase family protein [Deinococcus metallilatus]RXJ17927.1 FAA hydrolase family protein [Deinococcus metallilatus]TLK32198.1 fumarylacetoacetate hydrolase family protein [Deinococcus metallilatus]GMA15275.1 2-hydroxyhepta-2,4-diene-1,7-dioate isomerase [Deinococcus metallila
MKLLRYGPAGQERPGLLDASGTLRDLSAMIPDLTPATLTPATLDRLRALSPQDLPAVTVQPRLGPCVGQVGKFVCIGLNYRHHADETGAAYPEEPILFMKATSAIIGPNDDVLLPPGSTKSDWEVELGVVIGRLAKRVSEADALSHIAGYCVVNDLSEREYQLERGGTWDKGKGCDTFGPIGPWLVTTDDVPDPQALGLWLDVDGVRRQTGHTGDMIFSVAQIVSYVSRFMSLQPGDIISTGTPHGVALGMTPPPYLRPGQVMHLGIDGLGEQRQTCRADI